MTRLLLILGLFLALPLHAQVRVRSGTSKSGGTFSAGGTITPPPTCDPPNTVIDGVCTPPAVPTAENLYCGPGDVESFPATDGVADLPTACVYTAMGGSPSPNTPVITATTALELTNALTSAVCGDTIVLNAGTTYAGHWTLPNKACDATHWITIRTSEILNANFPPEGTRATPCEINQTSVPYYPQYSCMNPGVRMPTVATNAANTPVFTTAAGANHYRLIGLNLTTSSTSLVVWNRMLELSFSDHIIVDRSLCHNNGAFDAGSGLLQACAYTTDATYIAFINSWFYDVFCKQTCSDAWALGGGGGDADEGPIKIYNNLIAAGAESFIWGGSGGTTAVPHDFEIRSNHSFKPLSWYLPIQGGPGPFSPTPGLVKNLGEYKNGRRALIEGNVFENSFSGWQTDQFANGFLLTPKSQGGTSPAIRVEHVTVRYNQFRRVGRGMQITITTGATCVGAGCVPDGPPLHHVNIHDNLFQDLSVYFSNNATAGTNPASMCFDINSSIPSLPITDLTIDHNTCITTGNNGSHTGLAFINDGSGRAAGASYTNYMANFKFTNNLSPAGIVPTYSGNGTVQSPAVTGFGYLFASNHSPTTADNPDGSGAGLGTNTLTFAKNVLGISQWTGQTSDCTGGQAGITNCPTSYLTTPGAINCGSGSATCFPSGAAFTGIFVDYNAGHDGDYHLISTSVYKNAGTDGADIGANIDAILTKISGVRNPTTYAPLVVATTNLASGIVGTAYTTTLTATGGAGPYKRWALQAGTLPTGITQKLTGILSGTPTVAGNYNYTALVQDFARQTDTQDLSISIAPKLTSLAPTSGVVGDTVTLTGAGFGATQGTNSVSFNNGVNASSITSWSDTQIVCLVPTGAITGLVRVSINSVYSAGITFTISVPPASPNISSLTPASGLITSSFTIAGTNFGATQGSSTVSMNGTPVTCSSWSATSLTCTVPSSATTGNVVVRVGGVNSNGVSFTVTGNTVAAASCSIANINTAIASANNGDTVTVPSGSCTWSSSPNFSTSKSVKLVGAGIGSTNITVASVIEMQCSSHPHRLSGFSFTGSVSNVVAVSGDCDGFRIDHNSFASFPNTTDAITVDEFRQGTGDLTGLIDHNSFTGTNNFRTVLIIGENTDDWPTSPVATGNTVVIEANTITFTAMTNAGAGCVDSNYTGHYVWRKNTTRNCLVTAHGVCNAPGTVSVEVYDNDFTANSSEGTWTDGHRLFHHQGSGEAMVFGNRFTSSGGKSGSAISVTHYRSCPGVDTGCGYDRCDGTGSMDGNTGGGQGYACLHQPGRKGPGLTPGTLSPYYLFDNLWSDDSSANHMTVENPWGGCSSPAPADHVQANRDYYDEASGVQTTSSSPFNGTVGSGWGTIARRPTTCTTGVGYWATDQGEWDSTHSGNDGQLYKCTSTNTWTLSYTPYAYPHPLSTP